MSKNNMDRLPGSYDFNEPKSVIKACKAGDSKAQRALIQHYFGYVKSICLRYSTNDQDAEEMINDSFMKVFSNLDKYHESHSFKSWIRTIAINTSIDQYRRNLRQPGFDNLEQVQMEDIHPDIFDQISAEEILAMVRELTPAYRLVFTLYAIDGYTHKEIAEKLGISEGTSKSNLQDARRKLKAMILKQNPALFYAYDLKTTKHDEG